MEIPGNGDFVDMHHYGKIEPKATPRPDDKRAASLGEFGGKGLFVRGHMWPVRNDAYEMMLNREVLTDTYVLMTYRARADDKLFRTKHGHLYADYRCGT